MNTIELIVKQLLDLLLHVMQILKDNFEDFFRM